MSRGARALCKPVKPMANPLSPKMTDQERIVELERQVTELRQILVDTLRVIENSVEHGDLAEGVRQRYNLPEGQLRYRQ